MIEMMATVCWKIFQRGSSSLGSTRIAFFCELLRMPDMEVRPLGRRHAILDGSQSHDTIAELENCS